MRHALGGLDGFDCLLGYTKDHAEITLNVLRENPKLRKLFDEKYC